MPRHFDSWGEWEDEFFESDCDDVPPRDPPRRRAPRLPPPPPSLAKRADELFARGCDLCGGDFRSTSDFNQCECGRVFCNRCNYGECRCGAQLGGA